MKIRPKIRKDSLKFISVITSLLIWFYVINSEKIKFEKTVEIEYILPEGKVFSQKPTHEVTFYIEGPRAFVRSVIEKNNRMVIDLSNSEYRKYSNYSIDINSAKLSLPFGMVAERVLPRKVNIRLENRVSKVLPLKTSFTGKLPRKMILKNIAIIPPEIEISGPKSLISKMKEVPLKAVDLENLVGSDSIPVELSVTDERLIFDNKINIKLLYEILGSSSNLILDKIPIQFLTENKEFYSKTKVAKVKVKIPDKISKNRLNISSSIQVWADIPKGASGKVRVPLRALLPNKVELLDISPKSIVVNVR